MSGELDKRYYRKVRCSECGNPTHGMRQCITTERQCDCCDECRCKKPDPNTSDIVRVEDAHDNS